MCNGAQKQVSAGVAPCNMIGFMKLFRTSIARQVSRKVERLSTSAMARNGRSTEFHSVTPLCETGLVRPCTQLSVKSFKVLWRLKIYLQVQMKWKIIYAYLKGLSKGIRMAFSLFEYLLSFQRYSSFCSKIDDVTNRLSTKKNHKIKNIMGNIAQIGGPKKFSFSGVT